MPDARVAEHINSHKLTDPHRILPVFHPGDFARQSAGNAITVVGQESKLELVSGK
jgi:hypothetical protein